MEFLKNNKLLNWGIFAVIAIVLFYVLGTRTGKGKETEDDEDKLDAEIKKKELTYDISQYLTFADKLYTAMSSIMDDEDAIYSVMTSLRTKSDVLQLIKSFGDRRIQFTLGSSPLSQWFQNRLSKSEIAKINEILSRNSISFQF